MRNPVGTVSVVTPRVADRIPVATRLPSLAERTSAKIEPRWWYFLAMIGSWVFTPELRRLANWKSGFHAIDVLSIVPLVLIVPLALTFLGTRHKTMDKRALSLFLGWAGVFGYSLIIGFSNGQHTSALYSYALFVLPAVAGLWIASDPVPLAIAARRIGVAYVVFAAIVSLYGIYQYVALPPWDALWMINAGMDSIGQPLPYLVRVFSVLNAPGACAEFLTVAIFMSFFAMRGRSAWWISLVLALDCAALSLTLVRTAWIAIPAGLVVYAIMTPLRARFFTAAAIAAAAMIVFLVIAPLVGATGVSDALGARLATFTNLSNDVSAQSRAEQIRGALPSAIETPLGTGLGVLGTAAKLNSELAQTHDFDSGVVARFMEMGYIGFLGYLLALLAGLALTCTTWWRAMALGKRDIAQIAAIATALQFAVFVMDLGGDAHLAFTGVSFWIALGLALHRDTAISLPRFRRVSTLRTSRG